MTALELRWDVTCGQRRFGVWVAWAVLEDGACHVPYSAWGDSEKAAKANLSALLVLAVAPRGMA